MLVDEESVSTVILVGATVNKVSSQEYKLLTPEALRQKKRHTVDECPVTGTGRVAGAARSHSDDANGDQAAGVEVDDRAVGL